jgi:carbon monoxide dehydrogenase subunit G
VKLENSFEVPAPPEQAWELLNDVPRVVPCMPGAELKEVVDENTWKATMHVKLGPISLEFATDITREEADAGSKSVVLNAKAREVRGRGGAQAKIRSSLAGAATGTQVTIETDLSLQGPVAQYGRGIVADVAAQLTKRFAECLAKELETNETPSEPPPVATGAPTPPTPPSPAPAPAQVKPVGGLRLGLGAVWRSFLGLFRRR